MEGGQEEIDDVCMYVYMYVCMYACMYIYIYIYIYIIVISETSIPKRRFEQQQHRKGGKKHMKEATLGEL